MGADRPRRPDPRVGSLIEDPPTGPAGEGRRLYGRHKGRRLRAGRRALIAELLPAVSIRLPESGHLAPETLFDPPKRAVWLEIGFGAGEHLAWQAAQNPDVGLIGCERFVNGVAALLSALDAGRLTNVRIHADDAREVLDRLTPESLDRVFILFPDPWPKLRHHKRRIVSAATLDRLAALMRPGAELRLATDDPGYAEWMLGLAPRHPAFRWLVRGPDDWRRRPPDWPPTRYEQKALAAGRRPVYLRLERRLTSNLMPCPLLMRPPRTLLGAMGL